MIKSLLLNKRLRYALILLFLNCSFKLFYYYLHKPFLIPHFQGYSGSWYNKSTWDNNCVGQNDRETPTECNYMAWHANNFDRWSTTRDDTEQDKKQKLSETIMRPSDFTVFLRTKVTVAHR